MVNKKEKKTKKINWSSVLFFLIGCLIGGFFGGRILDTSMGDTIGTKNTILFMSILFLFLIITVFAHIILHEGGHLLFGKLSGYQFVSFRIGSFMIVAEGGKYKLKRFSLPGTGGQCLMMPPKGDGFKYPFFMYNMGGSLVNMIIGVICLSFYLIYPDRSYLSLFLGMMAIIGIMFALLNGIPMKVSHMPNDGYNAMSLGKDDETRYGFWLQLYLNGLLAEGKRLRDIPENLFEFDKEGNLNNQIYCTIGVISCGYLHDKKLFEEAKELSRFLLEEAPGTLELHKNELRCELFFYEIIGQCRREIINELYTKSLKNYIKATSFIISRKRLMYAYELLVNQNEEEAEKQLRAFEKAANTYPYTGEIESERELLALISDLFRSRNNNN